MGSRDRDRRKRKRQQAGRQGGRSNQPEKKMTDEELAGMIADGGALAAADLADKVAAWCEKKGIEPHPQLEIAAGLIYVATMQLGVEGTIDAEQLDVMMAELAANYEAESGESGVMAAAWQVSQYTLETPLDDILPDDEEEEYPDDDEDDVEPAPPHVQKALQKHGAMMAKAVQVYRKKQGLKPAPFEALQIAAIQELLHSTRVAGENPGMSLPDVLELTRVSIHQRDDGEPEYLKVVDQLLDMHVAVARDPKLGEWIVDQLSNEYGEDELRDAFME